MKAIFLDRDGVLNPPVYNAEFGLIDSPLNPQQLHIFPRAVKAVHLINQAGIPAVLISNQPGIAKGKMSEALFKQIDWKMKQLLKAGGGRLDGVYYCLHHPDAVESKYRIDCSCRKPKPGLLIKAAGEMGLDLKKSFFIGDGLTDIAAGKKVGCKTILIGKEKCDLCQKSAALNLRPDYIAADLLTAVEEITAGKVKDGNIY